MCSELFTSLTCIYFINYAGISHHETFAENSSLIPDNRFTMVSVWKGFPVMKKL